MNPLGSLSPRRRRLVVVVLAVVVALVAAGAYSLFRGGDPAPAAQDQQGPVLLVPGYGGSTRSLEGLAAVLRDEGRDVTIVTLAGDGTGDLDVQAEVLSDAADSAMERTHALSVDVVGYSAGGVVTRLWVRDHGGAAVARRVVTLGSPHHGTGIASLAVDVVPGACPLACQQLVPDSDLLRALNAGDETPDGPVFVAVWTTTDEIVTPPESARLDGALNVPVQSLCPDAELGHRDLPSDPAVDAVVIAALGVGPPSVPTDVPCAPAP